MERLSLNDLDLNAFIREVHAQATDLDALMRDRRELALSVALAKIEDAARHAQWRLLELKNLK